MTQLVTAGEPEKKKGTKTKKCATPWDAYSSTPGERSTVPYYSVKDFTCTSNFSDAGVAAAANMVAAQADAAGAPMGDAVDDRNTPAGLVIVSNTVDSLAKDHPNSNAAAEIKKLFDRLRADPSSFREPFYQGADGLDADPNGSAISSLAAACEATLGAFRRATGIDYMDFRKKT